MTVAVLGTTYTIEFKDKKDDPKLAQCAGYCDPSIRSIVVENAEDDVMNMKDMDKVNKRIVRHEMIHAFMFESGLGADSEWAHNEEMVDWIAQQFPKMLDAFKAANAM